MKRPPPEMTFAAKGGSAPPDEAPIEIAGFSLTLRRAAASDGDLVVVLSTRRTYAMYREAFRSDVLFVADTRAAFYTHKATALARAVLAVAEREGHRRVLFTGGSKAGFGALLIGGLCARLRPDRIIRILAFQPRIFVWPYQPERIVPSYHLLHRKAAKSKSQRRDLITFGDVTFVVELPNLIVRIVYSERNVEDREQARALTGPNVSHVAVSTAVHNTMAFLNLVRGSPKAVQAGVDRMLGEEAQDEDGLSASAAERQALIRDILSCDLPRLHDMIEDAFALDPVTRPAGWARTVLARRLRRMARRFADLLKPHPRIRTREEVRNQIRAARAAAPEATTSCKVIADRP